MRAEAALAEVGVGQGGLGSDPLLGVELQHLVQEIPGQGVPVHVRDEIENVPGLEVDEVIPQHGRLVRPVRHGGRAEELEDLGELVRLVLAGEQRGPPVQLGEDAAAGPDVYRGGVGCPQQDLGSSVPEGHHLIKNICGIKLLIMIKCYRGPPDFIGWILSIKKS